MYDHVERHVYIGTGELPEELKPYEEDLGDAEEIIMLIPRVKDGDGKLFRLLPSFTVPFKRYSSDDIESALDESVMCTTTAGDGTIRSWKAWWHVRKADFRQKAMEWAKERKRDEGMLKSSAAEPLAKAMRAISGQGWLSLLLRLVETIGFRWTL